jgi:uncharacterized repeat protein (TIGR01451 family)
MLASNLKSRLALMILVVASLAFIIMVSQPVSAAGSWYVAPGGDDSNSCQSTSDPCATIAGSVNKASPGDTIFVAVGVYTSTTGSEVVKLDKNVSLSGGWEKTFTTQTGKSTIDGQGIRRGIEVSSSTVTAENFVIQNGFHDTLGGGIYNYSSTLTLTNTIVSNNVSKWMGGGIYNDGTITLNNTTVSSNSAGDSCCSGGGGGGGIDNYRGTVTLNNSAINGNRIVGGFSGSAIHTHTGATMILNNSTISGNSGSAEAIYSFVGTIKLNNSTIADNQGNGLTNVQGSVELQNTILANNTGIDCYNDLGGYTGVVTSHGYNLIGSHNGCTLLNSDLTSTDPRLGPLQDNKGSTLTHELLPGSPAINGGNPNVCQGNAGPLLTDQRGYPRYGRCDIGAYELQPIGFSTKTVSPAISAPGDPLTYTVTLTNGGTANLAKVLVTDTLPSTLGYLSNSLSATGGNANYANGVITWTGAVNADSLVTITFGAAISQTVSPGTVITNAVVINNEEEIFSRTAAVNVPHPSPVFLPLISKSPSEGTLLGRVTLNSAPAAGVALDLRFYNGSSWSTRATTTTDAGGNYIFRSVPSLSPGQEYYVRFINPSANADGRLSAWFTRDLTTFQAGSQVNIGEFDLADITLKSPNPGATLKLPINFQWGRRTATPSDSYQLELFDPNGQSDVFSPPLGYVGSYTMSSLPSGFTPSTEYGWAVWVNSPDGGIGASFYYNPIIFSNSAPNPKQTLSTAARRNLAGLRENLLWRIAP